MATQQPQSSKRRPTYVALIAANWLRTLTKFIIKSETKKAPIQYMKFTRERCPLFSFHVVSIIVLYSQPSVPIPFLPMDGPLEPRSQTDEDSYHGITITIEHGSASIRAGFAGNDLPSISIPSFVAIKANNEIIIGNQVADTLKTKDAVTVKPSIERGKVIDWEYLKAIWEYILNGYKDVNVHFITSSCLSSKEEREKIIQMFFEECDGQSFALWNAPTLSLYAAGRTTGIVVQSGYGMTEIVPIFEGYVLPHGVQQLEFCSYEIEADKSKYDEAMPWKGQYIGKYIVDAIKKCDVDIRTDLCGNIVIAGGNTMYDGIAEFIKKEVEEEMKQSMDNSYNVKIIAPPERILSSWIGGSILGSIS